MNLPISQFKKNFWTVEALGESKTSVAYNIDEAVSYAVQIVWSGIGGTPSGNFILEGSNFIEASEDAQFTEISDSSQDISAASGSLMINVEKSAYSWVRVKYTHATGTDGIVKAIIHAKRG